MDVLYYIFDWKQIINSFIGSILAVILFAPFTIYLIRLSARWVQRHRLYLGIFITTIGAVLILLWVGPSAYENYKILALARKWGGDEPQPRLSFSCTGKCSVALDSAAEICLDSKIQSEAERVAEYGARNRAGLQIFVGCMQFYGYSVAHCPSATPRCISLPDTGYRNPGSPVHYSYRCTSTDNQGIICDHKDP